jgi:hypothetical protein
MTQTAKLTSSQSDLLIFVAINKNTIVAAGDFASTQEAADVFVMPSNGWHDMTQTARLTTTDGKVADEFSRPAIWNDTIVIGASAKNSNQGAVYEYSRPAGGWADSTETAELTASDGMKNDYFGASLATNGKVILVGAEGAAINGHPGQGAVYVYTKPVDGWVTTSQFSKKITVTDNPLGAFGQTLSMTMDTFVGCSYEQYCFVFGN